MGVQTAGQTDGAGCRGVQVPERKIEGISLVDGHKLVIVNDNDFGVNDPGSPENGTDLWTFELPYDIK